MSGIQKQEDNRRYAEQISHVCSEIILIRYAPVTIRIRYRGIICDNAEFM